MKFLVIGDPIDVLAPATDTGFSIVRASLARGHEVHWAVPEDLVLCGTRVETRSLHIEACEGGSSPRSAARAGRHEIADFDAVWVRKDPPVDWKYISLCWLLALEERDTVIVNRPSLLLRHHEKMIPFDAFRAGFLREEEVPRTYLLTGADSPLPQDKHAGEWITKPWLGHGGRGVVKWDSLDTLRDEGTRTRLHDDGEPYTLLQPFSPEVMTSGDRRIFLVGGEYNGHFARIPAAGSIEANLARGGGARRDEMTAAELDTVARLGEYLRSIGIDFAGADMIAGRITEVNITAPTGLETFVELGGEEVGDHLVALVEKLVDGAGLKT